MDNENKGLNVYFYAKKTPRKKDGRLSVMGRIVLGKERVQFSTQVFMSPDNVSAIKLFKYELVRRTDGDVSELNRQYNLINLIYADMKYHHEDITLETILDRLKKIQKDPAAFHDVIKPLWKAK